LSSQAYAWSWGKKAEVPSKQEAAVTAPTPEPAAAAVPEPAKPAPAAMAQAPTAPAESAVEQAPAEAPPAPVMRVESPEIRQLREKKKKELNNTVWDIEITPMSGKGEKEKDTLVFTEGKVASESFSRRGFRASNFTLSLQDEKIPVVESMQTSEKEGILFWRVEFDAALATCRGIFSRQFNNAAEDYSFVSTAKKPYVPAPPPAAGETVAATGK
jgi:hypothetical protein